MRPPVELRDPVRRDGRVPVHRTPSPESTRAAAPPAVERVSALVEVKAVAHVASRARPPSRLARSRTTTSSSPPPPSSAAAANPPSPPPTIATSQTRSVMGASDGTTPGGRKRLQAPYGSKPEWVG